MADDKPIIIIKKSGGHGGHHGGAWKVAYADFVTAMMAFFMVMWLVNSAEVTTKQSIASYFRHPGLFSQGSGTPLMMGEAGILEDAYVPPHPSEITKNKGKDLQQQKERSGTDDSEEEKRITFPDHAKEHGAGDDPLMFKGIKTEADTISEAMQMQKAALERIAAELKREIAASPELKELLGIVDVKVEADGLNIEIMDTAKSSMFSSGSARIQPEAQVAFSKIAGIIKTLPNKIDIIGHTDATGFSSKRGGYSNWELSADRANAARRILELEGFDPTRITSVVGRADKEPKNVTDTTHPSNRRITLKMRFDFTKQVDLGQNPAALDGRDPVGNPTAPKIEIPEPKATAEPVQEFSARKVLSGAKDRKKPKQLPAAEPITGNPAPNSIFGENPVIGPPDPFSGY